MNEVTYNKKLSSETHAKFIDKLIKVFGLPEHTCRIEIKCDIREGHYVRLLTESLLTDEQIALLTDEQIELISN